MEWQGTITGEGERPLGPLEAVAAELVALFPGLVFAWSPSGIEQLAALDARRVELPDIGRRVMAACPSQMTGVAQVGEVEVSFNLGPSDPVVCVWATVGGPDGLATAALGLLQRPGWVLTSPEPLTVEAVAPNQSLDQTSGATLFFET